MNVIPFVMWLAVLSPDGAPAPDPSAVPPRAPESLVSGQQNPVREQEAPPIAELVAEALERSPSLAALRPAPGGPRDGRAGRRAARPDGRAHAPGRGLPEVHRRQRGDVDDRPGGAPGDPVPGQARGATRRSPGPRATVRDDELERLRRRLAGARCGTRVRAACTPSTASAQALARRAGAARHARRDGRDALRRRRGRAGGGDQGPARGLAGRGARRRPRRRASRGWSPASTACSTGPAARRSGAVTALPPVDVPAACRGRTPRWPPRAERRRAARRRRGRRAARRGWRGSTLKPDFSTGAGSRPPGRPRPGGHAALRRRAAALAEGQAAADDPRRRARAGDGARGAARRRVGGSLRSRPACRPSGSAPSGRSSAIARRSCRRRAPRSTRRALSYLAGRGDFSTVVEDFGLWLEARSELARREADRFPTWAELEALVTPGAARRPKGRRPRSHRRQPQSRTSTARPAAHR